MKTQNATKQIQAIKAIPTVKLWQKIRDTAIGGLIVIAGLSLTTFFSAPWWVAAIGCVAGAHMWSSELVEKTFKVIFGFAKDVLALVFKRDDPPANPNDEIDNASER